MPLTSKEGIASKGGAATGITGIILKAPKSCKISTCFFPPQIPWSSDRRTREWSCHGSWAQMKRLTAVNCEKCKKNGTKNTQFYTSFWGLEKPTHIFCCCSCWRETFIFNILIIKNWWSFGMVEDGFFVFDSMELLSIQSILIVCRRRIVPQLHPGSTEACLDS